MRFISWISPGAALIAIGLLIACVLGTQAAFPTEAHTPQTTAFKRFKAPKMYPKSRVGNRPIRARSSRRYSSRGSGSYSSRRSYRGGGYRYGK